MATFLDLSLVGFFGSIFLFLFVFAVSWGLLSLSKILGSVTGARGIYAIISVALALGTVVSVDASVVIATFVPWFVVFIIFLFLLFLIFRMFTDGKGDIIQNAIKNQGVSWTIIVIAVIILIASLSTAFGQGLLDKQNVPSSNIDDNNEITNGQQVVVDSDIDSDVDRTGTTTTTTTDQGVESTATNDFSDNVLATIINPKVMGLIVMMIIAFFTMLLIARSPDPDS